MAAQTGTIKHGFLEKMGSTVIISASWTTRWFVLTNDSLSYYTDQSLSNKRGFIALNHTCSVTRKPSEGNRKYLLNINDKVSGRNLLMCASEFSTLASWEQAINGVIQKHMDSNTTPIGPQEDDEEDDNNTEELRKYESMMEDNTRRKPNRRKSNMLQEGYLWKQGYKSTSKWTKCWCVLTQSHLSYFSDSSQTVLKSILTLDKDSYVTIKKIKAPDIDTTKAIALYLGNNRDNITARALTTPDDAAFYGWLAVLSRAIIQLRHLQGPFALAVRVNICKPGFHEFTPPIEETIYEIQLYINSRIVRTCHHFYNDLKEVNNKLRAVLSVAPAMDIPFPRQYRRSAFGVKLHDDVLEDRRFQLEHWAQEVIERYYHLECLEELSATNDVQNAVAHVFGCDGATLGALIDAANGKLSPEEAAVVVYGENAPVYAQSLQRPTDLSPMAAAAAAAMELHEAEQLASLAAAAATTNRTDMTSAEDASMNGNRESVGEEAVEGGALGTDSDALVMPAKASQLKKFELKKLALLCKAQNIDILSFKSRKQFVRALTDTYQKYVPYLHGKDARVVVSRLLEIAKKGPTQLLLPANAIEVDNIFVDLMRKLHVADTLLDAVSVEYCTQDKLSVISQCVSVWDVEIDFTKEDDDMLESLARDITVNSFLILTLQHRISQTNVANEWLHRFCDRRGINVLSSVASRLLESNPLSEIAAGTLWHILKCFRYIMESECRLIAVSTRGTIEMFASALRFEYPKLALQALELLSESVIFGGEKALYQVVASFRLMAREEGKKPFETLLANFAECDVELQSSTISLINSIMLYEKAINERLILRCDLNKLDFDGICNASIRKYKTGGTTTAVAVSSSADMTVTAPTGGDGVAASGEGQTEEEDEEVELTYQGRIKAGVHVCDVDMGPGVSDDGIIYTHPLIGVMEGYAIEVLERTPAESGTGSGSSNSTNRRGSFSGGFGGSFSGEDGAYWMSPDDTPRRAESSARSWGRFVTDRLSITTSRSVSSAEKRRENVSARRMWYRIENERTLVWYLSMDDVPENRRIGIGQVSNSAVRNPPVGSLNLSDVVQVLDYSSIASKLNFQLQNAFTLVVKEKSTGLLRHYHIYAETLRNKHKWMVAIHARLNQIALSRAAYRFPVDGLRHSSSATVMLRKAFEQHVAIYRSVTKEDVALMYSTVVADAINESDPKTAAAVDAMDITRFINYELQNHKYERKLNSVLKELATFVTDRYAPKPEVTNEDEAEKGKTYPLAVPDSDRVVPKAPPLPYVPAAKPPKRPRAKVRQLFWQKVKPINVVNTVWMAMEEPDFSWDEVDTRFAVPAIGRRKKAVPASSEGPGGEDGAGATAAPVVPKKIALFDSRRTQNIAIACGKLKKTPEEIFDMVLALDSQDLTEEVTDTILNLMVPTAEEVATIRAYADDVADLDFCGRLFTYFLGIERLEQRLQVHRIMLSWFEFANSVNGYISTIAQAVEELNDAECLQTFKTVLSCILSLGNYMNGATSRGQAHGYRMDVILKLKDVKQAAGYGRRSLLHFIVEQMPIIFPDLEPFYMSWKAVWTSVTIHYQHIEEMMKDLKGDLEKCEAEIEMAEFIEDEVVRCQLIEKLSKYRYGL